MSSKSSIEGFMHEDHMQKYTQKSLAFIVITIIILLPVSTSFALGDDHSDNDEENRITGYASKGTLTGIGIGAGVGGTAMLVGTLLKVASEAKSLAKAEKTKELKCWETRDEQIAESYGKYTNTNTKYEEANAKLNEAKVFINEENAKYEAVCRASLTCAVAARIGLPPATVVAPLEPPPKPAESPVDEDSADEVTAEADANDYELTEQERQSLLEQRAAAERQAILDDPEALRAAEYRAEQLGGEPITPTESVVPDPPSVADPTASAPEADFFQNGDVLDEWLEEVDWKLAYAVYPLESPAQSGAGTEQVVGTLGMGVPGAAGPGFTGAAQIPKPDPMPFPPPEPRPLDPTVVTLIAPCTPTVGASVAVCAEQNTEAAAAVTKANSLINAANAVITDGNEQAQEAYSQLQNAETEIKGTCVLLMIGGGLLIAGGVAAIVMAQDVAENDRDGIPISGKKLQTMLQYQMHQSAAQQPQSQQDAHAKHIAASASARSANANNVP